MLTALGGEADRVVGLEIGADDYVTKPFSPRELVLRVESVLRRDRRRAGRAAASSPTATWCVDRGRREVTPRRGDAGAHRPRVRPAALPRGPPGTAFSRDDLLQQVWGWSFGDQSTVTVHVRRLREKIEADPTTAERLVTVWGVGYRWEAAA